MYVGASRDPRSGEKKTSVAAVMSLRRLEQLTISLSHTHVHTQHGVGQNRAVKTGPACGQSVRYPQCLGSGWLSLGSGRRGNKAY